MAKDDTKNEKNAKDIALKSALSQIEKNFV